MNVFSPQSGLHLEPVLRKAREGAPLTREEVRGLIDLRDEREQARLFRAAREIRHRHFGDSIFLYGFVYFSTWCRRDCLFCGYRKSNPMARRYRKQAGEVVEIGARLAESGVHLIDLTMGEDPFFHRDRQGAEALVDMAGALKTQTDLPIMISPGVISRQTLESLFAAGVEWYACYQETHNRRLFESLRPNQDYHERLRSKTDALRMGFLIEEGILTGAGDSADDIVTSLEVMRTLAAHQIRVMTFVPQEGTPLGNLPAPSPRRELLIIAVMRLLFPDRLIPGSLDVGGVAGLRDRLSAGANVVTSIIPPRAGLVGVSQSTLDVEEGFRTVEGIVPILEAMGLRKATGEEYSRWIARQNGQPVAPSHHPSPTR